MHITYLGEKKERERRGKEEGMKEKMEKGRKKNKS